MNNMSQAMAVLASRGNDEWYTPPWLIDKARALLDYINIDPASSAVAQQWIGADIFHSLDRTAIDSDTPASTVKALSLKQLKAQPTWYGKLWLNPPFDTTQAWIARAEAEYLAGNVTEGLLLVNSNLGYKWFEDLWRKYPVCCLRERVTFIKPDGSNSGPAKRGQTLVYLPPKHIHQITNAKHLEWYFGKLGRIIPVGV